MFYAAYIFIRIMYNRIVCGALYGGPKYFNFPIYSFPTYNSFIFNKKSEGVISKKRREFVIYKLNERFNLEIPIGTKIKMQGSDRNWLASGRKLWTFDSENNFISNIGSTQSILELSKCINFEWGNNHDIIGFI